MTERDTELSLYELTDGESVSNGVSAAVAAFEGVSETDLTPLAESIDPDALNRLLAEESETNYVTFGYAGYEITATAESIRIDEPTD